MPAVRELYPFRPWVRRAGLSILIVATVTGSSIVIARLSSEAARWGWASEPALWIYIAVLWIGGARVYFGTWQPVAEIGEEGIVIRPVHQVRARRIAWSSLLGAERTTPGDRMIVYYQGPRGMRFVAVNLNLIKGRRAFEESIDRRLRELGFVEKQIDRSRHLSRPVTATTPSETPPAMQIRG